MKIRLGIAALLGSLMLSNSAFALSCMQPDLVKTLEEAKASEKIYHILVGKFVALNPPPKRERPDGFVTPQDHFQGRPPMISQSYFEGFSLAQSSRRDVHLSRFPVDIETSCAGPWCSDVPSGQHDIIAFVEARPGQAPLLKISPCPSMTFGATAPQVQKVRQCLDKTCESELPNW